MPLVEVLPGLHIKTARTDDRDIPAHWARLTIRQGDTPRHPADVLHLSLPDDAPWPPEMVRRIIDFIESRLAQQTPVLVECVAAVSRSPSAIVAYLAHRDGLEVSQALERLRQVYPPADPSARILDSLEAYFSQRADSASQQSDPASQQSDPASQQADSAS